MEFIGLLHIIKAGMPVYPGDSKVELVQIGHLDVDGFNNHSQSARAHSGLPHATNPREYYG